ncbi:MAG: 30S ribosomal protein S7 [Candidatus Bipolaricaulia bacterium]
MRIVEPDVRYNSMLVAKLINSVMQDGKKAAASKIVYQAFEIIKERTGESPLEIFNQAVSNCAPRLEVRSRRVGGANYQIPFEVPEHRQKTLALRWIVNTARGRSEYQMEERLANELLDASNRTGRAYSRKVESHRMAAANKAFAHYRW